MLRCIGPPRMTTEAPSLHIKLRGGNHDAFTATDTEIEVDGPARTGKTCAILLRLHKHASQFPGYRGLITRKTAVSLTSSCLRTLEEDVLYQWESATRRSVQDQVRFFGGSQNEPASYEYQNGSRIIVGGMDQPSKILGSDYDEIFCNEAAEFSQEDIETLKTRLSHGVLGYHSLICDTNPSYEKHWLRLRSASGVMRHIRTTLQDNPAMYNRDGTPTDRGRAYLDSIATLTGTRRQRFVLGEWVGMENAIYADLLDPERQLIELPGRVAWSGLAWGGMDYGRIHLSTVVALTEATDGYVWVRECWGETGGGKEQIKDAIRSQRLRFGVRTGVTDPIQEWAAQELGWKPAKSGAGSRKGRIERVIALLEADELRFDRYGKGVQELWDEMQMYRYEVKETGTSIEDVVVRKDDDRVAALEYAVEAMSQGALSNVQLANAVVNAGPKKAYGGRM